MSHTIENIDFDFRTSRQAFAQRLYGAWEGLFPAVERVFDEVLERHDESGHHMQLDRLDLNLGTLAEKDFDEHFIPRLRECLDKALRDCRMRKVDATEHAFELLTGFLLRGTLAVDRLAAYGGTLKGLFLYVAAHQGAMLSRFLRTYGHYTGLQERLVYQLDDPELEEGIRVLTPTDAGFICSYTRLLRRKYHTEKHHATTARNYRNAVWRVVYAWLLDDRGSVFNRKRFLEGTIAALASKLNMQFRELVDLLCSGIGNMRERTSQLPELLTLLDEIHRDIHRREKQRLALDRSRLYRTLATAIRQRELDSDSEWLPLLRNLLVSGSTARPLLRNLSEQEIRMLVPIVAPHGGEFVLSYADSLDRHHEGGLLSGRAGGDFGCVKWLVIFAALFENPGAGFNRVYFVERTLVGLAGHYNMKVYDLLRFLTREEHLARIDRRLPAIFNRLLDRYAPAPSVKNYVDEFERWLDGPGPLTAAQRHDIGALFSHGELCREWIDRHREHDYRRLLELLAPEHAAFLWDYARGLDMMGRQLMLGRRGGGSFSRIKWEFILRTIAVHHESIPTRAYLVRRSLAGLAARYNLAYVELLLYFMREREGLPVSLCETFDRLLREELQGLSAIDRESELGKALRHIARHYGIDLLPGSSSDLLPDLLPGSLSDLLSDTSPELRPDLLLGSLSDSLPDLLPGSLSDLLSDSSLGSSSGSSSDSLFDSFSDEPSYPPRSEPAGGESLWIANAGIVILSPYLPRLFDMTGLLADDKRDFRDHEARIVAIFLLQYLLYGDRKTEFAENELLLDKLLVGFAPHRSLPMCHELDTEQKETAESLLQGALSNWKKLGNTSVEGLREAFLIRNARLEESAERYSLMVEEKPYDMLLDGLPWNFRIVRFPWMEKMIEVKWR